MKPIFYMGTPHRYQPWVYAFNDAGEKYNIPIDTIVSEEEETDPEFQKQMKSRNIEHTTLGVEAEKHFKKASAAICQIYKSRLYLNLIIPGQYVYSVDPSLIGFMLELLKDSKVPILAVYSDMYEMIYKGRVVSEATNDNNNDWIVEEFEAFAQEGYLTHSDVLGYLPTCCSMASDFVLKYSEEEDEYFES